METRVRIYMSDPGVGNGTPHSIHPRPLDRGEHLTTRLHPLRIRILANRQRPPAGHRLLTLVCHSIELTLKGFLLAKGTPPRTLAKKKTLGHDLDKVFAAAKACGL